VRGLLVVFEGLDQSGKQTQAERLRDRLAAAGRTVRLLSFPSYDTHLGAEIGRLLHGEREYGADTAQLLYIANRFEWKPEIEMELARGTILLCDRYLASSIAYGEAHGIDAGWLAEIQRFLPAPDLTVLLDIAPETAAGRKAAARDRFERDLELLARVRASYRRQAEAPGWVRLAGDRGKSEVAADVIRSVETRLGLPSPR